MTDDTISLIRFIAAFLFVLGLMGGLALVMRWVNNRSGAVPARKRRLQVVETRAVDARRKLVLVRRDGVEHLVLTGPSGDTLIESRLESGQDNASSTEPAAIP